MLDFLKKYRLFPDQIIFLPRFGSDKCHVRHCEKEPDTIVVSVVELAGVHHQLPRLRSVPDQINFVGFYFGASADAVAFSSEASFCVAHSPAPSSES